VLTCAKRTIIEQEWWTIHHSSSIIVLFAQVSTASIKHVELDGELVEPSIDLWVERNDLQWQSRTRRLA
jgi:hypothetical protein